MKRLTLIAGFLICSLPMFAQVKKDLTHHQVKKTPLAGTHDSNMVVALKDSTAAVPGNVTIFALNPDQIQLLEYVISESNAGYKQTTTLINILKTQQYRQPPTPPPAKDSSSHKKD